MTNSPKAPLTVLYADDDPDDQLLVQEVFKDLSSDIQLKVFNDGVEILEFIDQLPVNDYRLCLIILDINMPRLTGKEVLLQLRKRPHSKDIPVVLFTTSNSLVDRAFAQQHGVGFLTKPISYEGVANLARRFINHFHHSAQEELKDRYPHDR